MVTFEQCLDNVRELIDIEYRSLKLARKLREEREKKKAERINKFLNAAIVILGICIVIEFVLFVNFVTATYIDPVANGILDEVETDTFNTYDSYCAINIPAIEYTDPQEHNEDEAKTVNSSTFLVTHYCGCEKCCSIYSSGSESVAYGCKGDRLVSNYSIATDPDIIPYGTTMWDDEGNEYIAQDVGGAIKGYHIDVFVGDHEEALELGRQYKTLYWEVQ